MHKYKLYTLGLDHPYFDELVTNLAQDRGHGRRGSSLVRYLNLRRQPVMPHCVRPGVSARLPRFQQLSCYARSGSRRSTPEIVEEVASHTGEQVAFMFWRAPLAPRPMVRQRRYRLLFAPESMRWGCRYKDCSRVLRAGVRGSSLTSSFMWRPISTSWKRYNRGEGSPPFTQRLCNDEGGDEPCSW